jgi:HK97 gp10 family phage protein
MTKEVHITGLKELYALLQSVPLKLERNVMRGALRKGATIVRDAAKMNIPVSPPNQRNVDLYGGYMGALRDSLRVGTRSRRGVIRGYVRAGGKSKKSKADTYYARWVEYGTSAHWIGNRWHPGARPHPYLRPALDVNTRASVVAIGNYMKHRLATKHGLNTMDISIGDEE